MSDFGAMIIAKKQDQSSFTNNELIQLSEKLQKIVTTENYCDSLGNRFKTTFNTSEDNTEGISILSEYYFSGEAEEDREELAFVKEKETQNVKAIVEILALIFPYFNFEGLIEEW